MGREAALPRYLLGVLGTFVFGNVFGNGSQSHGCSRAEQRFRDSVRTARMEWDDFQQTCHHTPTSQRTPQAGSNVSMGRLQARSSRSSSSEHERGRVLCEHNRRRMRRMGPQLVRARQLPALPALQADCLVAGERRPTADPRALEALCTSHSPSTRCCSGLPLDTTSAPYEGHGLFVPPAHRACISDSSW